MNTATMNTAKARPMLTLKVRPAMPPQVAALLAPAPEADRPRMSAADRRDRPAGSAGASRPHRSKGPRPSPPSAVKAAKLMAAAAEGIEAAGHVWPHRLLPTTVEGVVRCRPQPLLIGVDRALLSMCAQGRRIRVRRAIGYWVRSAAYVEALTVPRAFQVGLDSKPVERVSPAHRADAVKRLGEIKELQAAAWITAKAATTARKGAR